MGKEKISKGFLWFLLKPFSILSVVVIFFFFEKMMQNFLNLFSSRTSSQSNDLSNHDFGDPREPDAPRTPPHEWRKEIIDPRSPSMSFRRSPFTNRAPQMRRAAMEAVETEFGHSKENTQTHSANVEKDLLVFTPQTASRDENQTPNSVETESELSKLRMEFANKKATEEKEKEEQNIVLTLTPLKSGANKAYLSSPALWKRFGVAASPSRSPSSRLLSDPLLESPNRALFVRHDSASAA